MDQSLPKCIVSVASIQGARETYEDRIDVRARVVGHCPFLFCGIYDGHGGSEAADMAQASMLYTLEKSENFLSNNHEKFMESLKDGFISLDKKMQKHCLSWKVKGDYIMPSAGTTASTVIVSNGHAYIAHVGDSPVYLIKSLENHKYEVELASELHTPDFIPDHAMIQSNGGEIYSHDSTFVVKCKYEDRRKCRFLRMTRALGDFWLKHPERSSKIISAEPDVSCFNIAEEKIVSIILSSDGFRLSLEEIEKCFCESFSSKVNFSQYLVSQTCSKYPEFKFDNISVTSISFTEESIKQFPETNCKEYDCTLKNGRAKVQCFNQVLTKYPDSGILFKNNRAFYLDLIPIPITKSVYMVTNYMHKHPGYILPVQVDENLGFTC